MGLMAWFDDLDRRSYSGARTAVAAITITAGLIGGLIGLPFGQVKTVGFAFAVVAGLAAIARGIFRADSNQPPKGP